MVVGHLVHQDVVHEAAVLVEQRRVMRLPDLEPRDGVGGDVIGEPRGLRAADLDLAHVADVEQAHRAPHRVVFVDDAGVLHGHVPAAEIDHARTERLGAPH